MKKSIGEKYFSKNKLSVLEIILIFVSGVGLIVGTFVWGGGPIGLPIFAASIVGFFFCRSAKPKDSDIDELINSLLEKEGIEADSKALTSFDMKNSFALKGKDGQIRTGKLVIVKIDISKSSRRITEHTVDLINESVETKVYELSEVTKVSLNEETVYVLGARKIINYISSEAFEKDIPVSLDDVDAVKRVESLCNIN